MMNNMVSLGCPIKKNCLVLVKNVWKKKTMLAVKIQIENRH